MQLRIYGHGLGLGGGVDEMQNKAEAQPAWLQLTAGAAAGAYLSLAIKSCIKITAMAVYGQSSIVSSS